MKLNLHIALLAALLPLGAAVAQQSGSTDQQTVAPTEIQPQVQDLAQSVEPEPPKELPKVDVTDVKIGTGQQAVDGMTVSVHYTGYLLKLDAPIGSGKIRGKKFDSSYDRKQPITFVLGSHRVIPGWEAGLQGMKVGGRRTLVIPAELAYGARGAAGIIPPNATLVFDVDLVAIN
jgi:FKBP-type peptidyl-prolyl cis-trans isomerase FkpA